MEEAEIITEPVPQILCAQCRHALDVGGLPAFTEIACPECGTAQAVPARLGPFILQGVLGRGGMAVVYQGYDESLRRPVAVKVLPASVGANSELVETLQREAQAAAALNHPNIVQIYSFGEAHGQPYIVMELLAGGRFDQMIAKGEPLNEARVLQIGVDVAEGLNAANAIGLVHGDVKPENILLDNNGVAKVVDFGLARFKDREAVLEGVWGTPYYIAPEKVRRQPGDLRSDIYSLGATLFHAIAARPPFEGETPVDVIKARLHQPAPLLRQIRRDVNPEVEAIVARMLEGDPAKRYPTYASLLADMRKVLAGLHPPADGIAQTVRQGGKIILTKKKGSLAGGKAPGMRADTFGLGAGGEAGGPPDSEAARRIYRRERRIRLIKLAVGVLLVGLIGGGGTLGYLRYRRTHIAQRAQEAARAQLKALQEEADRSSYGFWVAHSNLVMDLGAAESSLERATNMHWWIVRTLEKLPEPGELTNTLEEATALLNQIAAQVTTARTAFAEFKELASGVTSNRQIIQTATNPAVAEAALATFTGLVASARPVEKVVDQACRQVQKLFKDIRELERKVRTEWEYQQEEIKRRAAEKADEERREKEEQERTRRAQEEAAAAEQELATIQSTREAVLPLVQSNRFQEAEQAFREATTGLRHDLARQTAEAVGERYRLLVGLKAFLVQAITAEAKARPEGFKYGWLVNGIPSLDVVGADAVKVRVRGRDVPWEQVSPAQMLRFIRRYITPELPKTERVQHYLEAAAYLYELAAGQERVLKQAAVYAALAVREQPDLQSRVARVFPDLPEPESGAP